MNRKTEKKKVEVAPKADLAEPSGEVTISAKEYQELIESSEQKQEYFDKLLRLHAEFENFKKRSFKDKEQFLKFANQGLICELIGILDNFERAFDSANKMADFNLLHQGVEMILKQIHKLLEKNGVKRIECVGKSFDPVQQEAIAHIETDEYPENTVVEEVQKGYLLEDRLIRPAVVKVSKKPEKDKEKK
ncbi:MAG: nucleotide exchange factor GrpE [Candidatus Omnitrophica bacterium]|nr:nucleotide exchange factor GrpE [Candidatus Omnitrophota bacterium]